MQLGLFRFCSYTVRRVTDRETAIIFINMLLLNGKNPSLFSLVAYSYLITFFCSNYFIFGNILYKYI